MNTLRNSGLFVLAMVLTVVIIDIAFFKNHFAQRLVVNIGIVMVFLAFYWRFLKK